MDNPNLISQLLFGPGWPIAWAILLISFVLGVLFTWLLWRGKVNALETKVSNEKALALQYETSFKKAEEEVELKESDLKKAGLANIKLRQDLQAVAVEKEDFKTELAVSKDQIKDISALNSGHKQSIEDLQNQILGLKTKNADLSASIESKNSANTNVEVYTLKTKLTKTNSELATAMVAIKNLQEERDTLKKANEIKPMAAPSPASNGIAAQKPTVVKRTIKKATPAKTKAAATKAKPSKVAAPKKVVAKRAPKKIEKENLRKIEGIGPKIEGLLYNSGILTFKQLSKTKGDKLKKILAEAGTRFKIHDPTTWPEQAAMAAKAEWDKLKSYQDFLKGGVDTSKK